MERADIDESFVRDLVRDQHPDLADLKIRPVPSGWDNQLWRLGDELAVRLPAKLTEVFESRLEAVAEAVDVRRVQQVWSRAAAAPSWTGPAVWLHAHLHPANALISDGTISGIVDFGDLCAGDPAADLAAAWELLPQGADADFFGAYGETTKSDSSPRPRMGGAVSA